MSNDDSTDGLEESEFEVEQILKHKFKRGKLLYLIRWKGFESKWDTWEPKENLTCPDKILAYTKKSTSGKLLKQKMSKRRRVELDAAEESLEVDLGKSEVKVEDTDADAPIFEDLAPAHDPDYDQTRIIVSDRNKYDSFFGPDYEPELILGATDIDGHRFLVKWKGTEAAELIPSSICNEKIPQLVIQFYESRLQWGDSGTSVQT